MDEKNKEQADNKSKNFFRAQWRMEVWHLRHIQICCLNSIYNLW